MNWDELKQAARRLEDAIEAQLLKASSNDDMEELTEHLQKVSKFGFIFSSRRSLKTWD